jgi:putative hydrolase of the HAD superfamily
MEKYRYILFDADNTLFDFDRSEHEALAGTFLSLGTELDESEHEVYHRINDALWKKLEKGEVTREELKIKRFAEFLDHLGRDDVPPEKVAALYVEELSKQSFLIDGAPEVCEKLSASYPLYLITNGITAVQRRRFASSPIRVYFRDIFISEEMGSAKPSADYFKKVCESVGDFEPSHYVVVGDSLSSDIKGAVNFGCDSIWVASGDSSSDLPTYTVNGITGVLDILS